ncbi:UV radiation resistance-associated protein-like [Mya arenaria]|uniref:UV radiation resistance-associated protein-like n=1 Tax=Mya arenaria TaxID=6604 RepID=UPI0022E377D1|nr:UV radiation resistance-associated protein-like [Mya arenaria]
MAQFKEKIPSFVKNPYDLPTFQRRLRHVKSVTLRNLQYRSYWGKDVTQLQVYFTLHKNDKNKEFYRSEGISGSLNPSWKSIDIRMYEDEIDIQSKSVVLRVWVRNKGHADSPPHLLIDWTIHLSGLVYFSEKAQKDQYKYVPNMVVIGMFDKYFTPPQHQISEDFERELLPRDPAAMPKQSYTINTLSRIHTVLRAISQMQASVKRLHSSIEDRLLHSQEKTQKLSVREDLLLRVTQMKHELSWQMNSLQRQNDVLDNWRSTREEKSHDLKGKFHQLEEKRHDLDDQKKIFFQTREKYIKENYQLLIRRKQLVTELTTYIYPITERGNEKLCVCGVYLPNSEEFQGYDETAVSVGLGYTCHLVIMMSLFLDFPVRYPMDHLSSRSTIIDHIHPKLEEKDKVFPLYTRGKDKFQFHYGVFMLNKNISQLRFYCGLGTTDLRLTLPNIKSMLESRLGIKFDSIEKAKLELRDTEIKGPNKRKETESSSASGGRNAAFHSAEEYLGHSVSNGTQRKSDEIEQKEDIPVLLTELSIQTEQNIPQGEDIFKPADDSFFRVRTTAFGNTDSTENSSCGSFSEQMNGAIKYDMNFSLSPSPGSVENNPTLIGSTDMMHAGSKDSLKSGDMLEHDITDIPIEKDADIQPELSAYNKHNSHTEER